MFDRRTITALVIAGALLTACGSDDDTAATTPTPATTAAPTTAPTVVPRTTAAPTTATTAAPAPTTAAPPPTTAAAVPTTVPTTTVVVPTTVGPLGMPPIAVWPADDVRFDTPEEAASDFIAEVFGVEPLLGPYLSGDSMSGEFEVLSPLDDDDPTTTRPMGVTLFVRQFGAGWFVLGAASDGVTIDAPGALAEVPAAPLQVNGSGRGFEGTVVVRAIRPGDPTPLDLDILITAWDPPVPYTATVDLSGLTTGDVVAVIAVGDTGIAATGEFSAIPVVIG